MDHQLYLGNNIGKTKHRATGITAVGVLAPNKPRPQVGSRIRAPVIDDPGEGSRNKSGSL